MRAHTAAETALSQACSCVHCGTKWEEVIYESYRAVRPKMITRIRRTSEVCTR